MTIAELIALLTSYPPETPVFTTDAEPGQGGAHELKPGHLKLGKASPGELPRYGYGAPFRFEESAEDGSALLIDNGGA